MACGLPIVGFKSLYGPVSIVKDGNTGKLVPLSDVNQLADAICWMIEHPEERLRMGKKGRSEARKYLPDQIMPLWYKFYEPLITGHLS